MSILSNARTIQVNHALRAQILRPVKLFHSEPVMPEKPSDHGLSPSSWGLELVGGSSSCERVELALLNGPSDSTIPVSAELEATFRGLDKHPPRFSASLLNTSRTKV